LRFGNVGHLRRHEAVGSISQDNYDDGVVVQLGDVGDRAGDAHTCGRMVCSDLLRELVGFLDENCQQLLIVLSAVDRASD
jgi:hypothetical protein